MECFCICSDPHGDMPSVWTEEDRKARKEHKCCECGEIIKVGEKYEYFSGCYDGKWWVYKTCEVCSNIRDDLCCDGYILGELWTAIWEALGTDYVTGESIDDEG